MPDMVTDIFGGENVLLGLLNSMCDDFILFQVATIAAVIISLPVVNIVFAAKGKFRPRTVSIINLLLKLLTIPVYIMLCFAPVIALIGSVWGLGIALAMVVLTAVAVLVTALFSIPAVVSNAHHKKIGKGAAFIMGFLSFVPVADVAMAVVIIILSNKKNAARPTQ